MQPIANKKRIQVIDFLRGIAIIGILQVNMLDFHSPFLEIEYDYWEKKADLYTYALIDVLAQGNFYPLFAFLFGFGAFILLSRAEQKGLSVPALFARRMVSLLFLGIIHAFLIWHGDILITYAVCGFLILFFYKFKGLTLLRLSLWLYVIPYGILGMLMFLAELASQGTIGIETDFTKVNEVIHIYSDGSFSEIFSLRANEWMAVNGFPNMFFIFLSIFPCMLAGLAFAKLGWLANPKAHQKNLLIMFLVSFPLGLLVKMLPYLWSQNYASQFAQDFFGGPLLTLAIITGVTLFYDKSPMFRKMGLPFARLGRMSLTNYLMHSLIGTFIFYSYGLGLYGEVGAFMGSILAFAIILIQLIFTKYWFQYFKMGPIEYVWRIITYADRPSFRQENNRNDFQREESEM